MVTPDNSPAPTPSATDRMLVDAPGVSLAVGRIKPSVILRTIELLPTRRAKEAVFWFANHCAQSGFEQKEMARLLQKKGKKGDFYTWTSIYQTLTGRRTESGFNLEPIIEAIERYRATVDVLTVVRERGATDYVPTRLGATIWERAQKTYDRGKIGFIFGESFIGKTRNLLEFVATRPPGSALYIDMPARPSLRGVAMAVAHAKTGIMTMGRATDNIIADIFDVLDRRTMLVVDNAHRALRARGGNTSADIFDFFQQLYDVKGVPLFFSMTNEGRDQLVKGVHKVRLNQIWRRRLAPLQLPDITPEDDLSKFAASVGLPAAQDQLVSIDLGHGRTFDHNELELQRTYNEDNGLGAWLTLLQAARALADEQQRPITWGAVLRAYCEDVADAEVFI